MNQHGTWGSLCKTCRTLHRMATDFQDIDFGIVAEIHSKRTCPICLLVFSMLFPRPVVKYSPHEQISPSQQRITLRKMGKDGFLIWQDGIIRGELHYFFHNYEIGAESNWWFQFKDAVYGTLDTLDYVKVNRWITKCNSDNIHCKIVHSIRSMGLPVQTYFIDTQDNCLAYRDTSVRYLALSYVWGDAVMFKLKSSTCNALQQPGAFLSIESSLSPVVRDAIEFSRQLEERYLWIDALCIPQDNETQKARLITQMESIYAQAFLTIVALRADGAESPLHGEQFLSWFSHICDNTRFAFSEYCLVNAMLVVTEENETERVGIGVIHEDVWQVVAKVRENMRLR